MTDTAAPTDCPLPDGEYAIVEQLGHRTMVGRVTEIERFGVKMMALEPIFKEALLPAVHIGGPSLYQVTPCSREVAWARRPQQEYQLPVSVRATLPAELLAPPPAIDADNDEFDPETPDDLL